MRVTQKNIDDLNLVVTLNIEQGDYFDKQRKILNDFRRKAELKGFRKGMAPMSLIEKLHGRSALLDAVNDLISEGLNNFISENKLNVLGEPLPNEKEQKPIDWENDSEFEFVYDIALSPSVKVELNNEDKIPYYEVVISEEEKKTSTAFAVMSAADPKPLWQQVLQWRLTLVGPPVQPSAASWTIRSL